MLEQKLKEVERKFHELTELLSDPVVLADNDRLMKYAKARAELELTVNKYQELQSVTKQLKDAKDMLQTETDANCARWRRWKSTSSPRGRPSWTTSCRC